jgi:hypothetical protein
MNTAFKAGCMALGLFTLTSTQAAQVGPFFNVGLGGNIVDKFDTGGGTSLDLDFGMRLDGSVGYNFIANNSVSVGAAFETGYLFNSINEGVAANGARTPIDGDLWQIPFLAKFIVRFMPDSVFVPFIAIGGGGVYSATEIRRIGNSNTFIEGDETDPGAEGAIGFKIRINDTMGVGAAYKCLVAFPDGFDEVVNHSFVAAFSMSF